MLHGFHIRLNAYELSLLARLAKLADTSKQKLARKALRAWAEQQLGANVAPEQSQPGTDAMVAPEQYQTGT